jgi:hypothetical protein
MLLQSVRVGCATCMRRLAGGNWLPSPAVRRGRIFAEEHLPEAPEDLLAIKVGV